jgi:hypothetical protein
MAKIKVSELTPKGAMLNKNDLLLISEFEMADTYISKSVTGLEVMESVKKSNAFGSFIDLNTQTTIANTPTPMRMSETTMAMDVSIDEETKMVVEQRGIYNVQFSAQIYRTSGGTSQHIDIWFRVNGTDIDNSNTRMTVANNGHYLVASWNLFVPLNSNDYIEIIWSTTASTIILQSDTVGTIHPAVPSVIATINRIN